MKNLFFKTRFGKLLTLTALALFPLQASQAQEVTVSAEAVALIASGNVEEAKKLLIASGIKVEDATSINTITQAILQAVLKEAPSPQLGTTIRLAVASLTQAVLELSSEANLTQEQTSTAVMATAQGAVTAVITAPNVTESNLTDAIAASSSGATNGAMQGASKTGTDITTSAKAATEGSIAAVATLVDQKAELTVIAQAVQAAATGSSQAAVATAAALGANPSTVVVAVAASAETGADSIDGDAGVTTVINEAVSTGIQQGTLSGAVEAGITGEAAEALASEAVDAADNAASNDFSGGETDTPDPVTTDDTADETEVPSGSTNAPPV